MTGQIMLALGMVLLAGALCIPAAPTAGRLAAETSTTKNPREPPQAPHPLHIAADIELFAACVESGLGLHTATSVVAEAAASDTASVWRKISQLEAVGIAEREAFREMRTHDGFAELATIIESARQSGARIAPRCRELAVSVRADATDHARAAAERAGVLIALPLAVCFLPAFILLGLAPVVISLATDLLATSTG
ncbi:type II secretion system F family protein [Corynebacterium propinquum]|uniref:type II secretion system F family protein n=1 Tax=Corynebacterium propinquum TaxID=43769 RepID=UPI0003771284|nr:type II secretion system F family protein [Corynebacterium propinquum]MDK4251482.1 type II secretion system F family protein [Corynebacterium propinquum]MDK4292133.1 type II secretion system F family protein [Corynebacterium propinquum]MDK4320226.1 type II secretion system F family protein [Corynebacterium propinquum]PZQ26728.1 MAG: secretion system protein F [Corynebacterium propinquum]QQU91438.1 type II secretion system F family protein [Corynebacterium propinquum]